MSQRFLIVDPAGAYLPAQDKALAADLHLEVEVTRNVESVLRRLRSHPFAGALINLDADGDLGFDLCASIRRDATLQGLRIAVLSVKPKQEALKGLVPLRTGMDLFLPLPMSGAALLKAIEGWAPTPSPAPAAPPVLDRAFPAGPQATGAVPRAAASASTDDGVVFPVWFGTNRRPTADGRGFTSERHTETTRGRAEVFIPKAHRFGELGNPFWKRLLRFDLRDDHLRFQCMAALPRDAFYAELRTEFEAAKGGGTESHALLFIHGFNVSFEEAAIRTAQMGCDLKVPGATAFFSWPSKGEVEDYLADEATIEASEGAIMDFLVEFLDACKADKVHVIAHSMGNRGLLRALQRIAGDAQKAAKVRFDQIILAAPDVDRDVFLDLARNYPPHAARTTLYASDGDKAVHLSALLHEHPRAGYFAPYTTVQGIDTIAVPDFDIDLLGHAYFAQAEALLHDIFDLMRYGQRPDDRQRLSPLPISGQVVWELKR